MARRFAFDEQIAAQPAAVRAVLARLRGAAVPALDPARPVVFAGIGSSLHACRVAARWVAAVSGGVLRPAAVCAHELAHGGPLAAGEQLVVVSHRGGAPLPPGVIAAVAVVGEDAPPPPAAHVVRTCPRERAETHSVSYVAGLAALGRIAARLCGPAGAALDAALDGAPDAIERTLALPQPAAAAARLHGREPILVTGFADDSVTAAEAALKLKEGVHRWAEGLSLEQALHGPLAALRPVGAALALSPPRDDGGRTAVLRHRIAAIGAAWLTWGDAAADDLRFAPVAPLARPLVAIVPAQRLAADLARLEGTDPDRPA